MGRKWTRRTSGLYVPARYKPQLSVVRTGFNKYITEVRSRDGKYAAMSVNDGHRIWMTKTMKLTKYSDLGDQHLFAIVRILKRSMTEPHLAYPNLWAEAASRKLNPTLLDF